MPGIAIAVAVVLLVVAVPRLRAAALSLLGLLAIVTVGSALFAAFVWALYEAKPWLTSIAPAVVREGPPPETSPAEEEDLVGAAEADLAAAIASEEAERLEEEQQRLAEERLHSTLLVARARVILEEDRKLAAQATAYPLPSGVSERLGDIMAIRIPSWRDEEVKAAQKKSIRTWLTSIGLDAGETASIVTAKAWGALYDMWVAENPEVSPGVAQAPPAQVATTPVEQEPSPEAAQPPRSEAAPAASPREDPLPPPRRVARPPAPRRQSVPRPPPRPRRPPPEREVGPFGY